MDTWAMAQIYGTVSVALAGTSYFTLYRPAVSLAEEILDEDLPLHRGWTGAIMWFLLSTLVSPLTAIILLKNDNNDFIESFAVTLSERIIKGGEE